MLAASMGGVRETLVENLMLKAWPAGSDPLFIYLRLHARMPTGRHLNFNGRLVANFDGRLIACARTEDLLLQLLHRWLRVPAEGLTLDSRPRRLSLAPLSPFPPGHHRKRAEAQKQEPRSHADDDDRGQPDSSDVGNIIVSVLFRKVLVVGLELVELIRLLDGLRRAADETQTG